MKRRRQQQQQDRQVLRDHRVRPALKARLVQMELLAPPDPRDLPAQMELWDRRDLQGQPEET